jgi:hypothetical protein
MDSKRLHKLVAELGVPHGGYVLFGGTILAALGIRDAGDIDIFVTEEVFNELRSRGWKEKSKKGRPPYLVSSVGGVPIQAFHIWVGGGWQPDIPSYISNPEVVDGLPFMPLRQLYDWKVATRRPKDIEDITLIENYWQKQ